ncbi:SGNH/GDSL hydrolase family protein [Weissella paramesenteroides]|uniref:SGNH/GDSL hydrolase family protein n=1 Tax=Weissella paramesenteroides TaxID=1249 RepID=UPI001C1F3A6F|nr:SGNH/GDSL hydrolase family protein [Weissella paramesenteroides]MBU7557252.1 SGNH/GDSL hydrolase family protein [Weissella paramesenteroides]
MEVRSKVKKILGQWRHKKVQNDWTNKNVVVFGDSIVAGQELVREETPYRDAVYAKLASYYLNAHKLENFAETGTGQFKGQHHLDHLTGWTHSFEGSIQHYRQEIQQADVVLIAYGNNDWKQPNPDGSLHTLDEVKVKLRENIQRIRLINHHVQLVGVLETLAFRKHKPAWHLEGPNGFTYQEMLSAFIEVYQECDIPIFDIRDYHLGNHMDEYVDDRDHFTLPVHQLIAKCLADFVRNGYKSPTQRFGETVKFIFDGNLFKESDMRDQLISKINELSKKGKRSEILWFDLVDNYQEAFNKFIVNNNLPTNLKVTNIYQYYAAPLRYNDEIEVLIKKNNELLNNNEVPVIRIVADKLLIMQHDNNWSEEMTQDEFIKLWLKHYISTKDEVYSLKAKRLISIDPLKI